MPPRKVSGASDTIQNGKACTLIDFEGAGDLASLPAFDGITLPGWLSIIEYNVGGSGDFSGEPSPVTSAFWLYGNQTQQQIIPPVPASSVSFYYSSYYNVTLTAYDKNGAVVATATGPANFDSDTGVYDYWYPLEVETTGNQIASVTVNGYANYTGIDNLNVCTTIGIDSIEVTQAIQQIQTLSDLDASLMANAEPPVPIIAGKPAVLRVYMDQVDAVANVTVAISGVATETKNVTVQPNCDSSDQRALTAPCQSVDFYFTPPMGSWNAHIEVLDSNNNVLDKHDVPITSRATNSLRLRAVSICDALDPQSHWLCAPASAMTGLTTLISKIAPTSTVNLDITSGVVRRDYASFTNDPCPCPPGESQDDKWWDAAIGDVNNMYGFFDSVGDSLSSRHTTYFGMIRPALAGGTGAQLSGVGGMAHDIPSNGAGSRTSALRFTSNTETNVEVVAHETGHTLGLHHTGNDVPQSPAAPPGCYNLAGLGTGEVSQWTFADNYIQSTANYEYGFDVAAKAVLDPMTNFEVMSYCSPRWISPVSYKVMIATLGGGAVSSTSVTKGINTGQSATIGRDNTANRGAIVDPAAPVRQGNAQAQGTIVTAPFWFISGNIVNNAAVFNPMFTLTVQGNNGSGSGTYSLQVQSGGGGVLYTQNFTPQVGGTETISTDVQLLPAFSLLVPVTAGAAKIVMLDPGSNVIGTITLGGTPPVVTVTNPTASFPGTGIQTLSWTIVEPGFSSWTTKVLYSPNNGATWSEIGMVTTNTLTADFSTLPGSSPGQALIQVLVSDGVNTGTATSPNFTVLKKTPTVVTINTPAANAVQKAADPVQFSGVGYDPDDGTLTGTSLQWSSSVQGQLGTGSPLLVNLLPGVHTITLKATDSDGNFITTTTAITIGGQPPVVNLAVNPLNSVPTTCVQATISAIPGQNGAPLSAARYSLNNGVAYTNIPLNQLPFRFIVPGSGFFHLLTSATDASGQFNAQDSTFFVSSPCTQATINGVASTTPNGSYGVGQSISIQVTFTAAVTVTGTPQLTLNSGGTANYTSGSGSNVLTFTYTVGTGETTQHLDYASAAALNLNGGTIVASSTAALLTLSAPGSFGSLGYNSNFVINSGAGIGVVNVTSSTANGTYGIGATISIQVVFSAAMNALGTPQLALNSGGNAIYSSGSGTNTLTFMYTVAAGDNSALLDYSSTNALIGSFSAAQLPILTLVTPGTPGSLSANKSIVISTVPTVTNATSTTPNGVYGVGAVITIKTTFSAVVTVLGTPQVALNSGGLANYTTGSGTSTLTFTYTVAAGQNSARLDFLNTSPFAGGGTIKDATGHAANLAVAAPGVAGSLSANTNIKIDTQAPAAGLQFYPVAPCRLVDTRGVAAGFNGIAPFSGPSIAAGGTLTIPVQSASEATANTTPAPCGVIPSTALAYSINITVVPQARGRGRLYLTLAGRFDAAFRFDFERSGRFDRGQCGGCSGRNSERRDQRV